jgi:hypothetical protein
MPETQRSRVTALLARGPSAPQGDTRCGLQFELFVDPSGRIEPAEVEGKGWPVRRFWRNREDWNGILVEVGEGWALRSVRTEDEPLWNLEIRTIRPGEFLTLLSPTDGEFVFRIVNVEAL